MDRGINYLCVEKKEHIPINTRDKRIATCKKCKRWVGLVTDSPTTKKVKTIMFKRHRLQRSSYIIEARKKEDQQGQTLFCYGNE